MVSFEQRLDAVENVDVDDDGTFKYILIKTKIGDLSKHIVRGYGRCEYHADIFDEVSPGIQGLGVEARCEGGGRIKHDPSKKELFVYGYSVGYGKADHTITVAILKKALPEYSVTYSDEGY